MMVPIMLGSTLQARFNVRSSSVFSIARIAQMQCREVSKVVYVVEAVLARDIYCDKAATMNVGFR